MPRPSHVTEPMRVMILADLDRDMTQNAVARKYGITRSVVANVAKRAMGEESNIERENDMTEEDLERLIAEQLPTMPNEPKVGSGPRLPQAVSRGRGLKSRKMHWQE